MTARSTLTLANIAAHTAHVARTIPGRQARTIAIVADLLADRLPPVAHQLAHDLDALDGFPEKGDRNGGRASGISRPTERVALQRHGDPWPGGRGAGPAQDAHNIVVHICDAFRWVDGAARIAAGGAQRPQEPREGVLDIPGAGETRIGPDTADRLALALVALNSAHSIADRYSGTADPRSPEQHRCIGTGDATGATCEQMADYRIGNNGIALNTGDGRCIDCRQTVARRDRETRRRQRRRTADQ